MSWLFWFASAYLLALLCFVGGYVLGAAMSAGKHADAVMGLGAERE